MAAPLLLIAVLAVPASAATIAKLPDCIHVSSTSRRYMPDLDAVRECQDKVRQKLVDDAQSKGKPLSYQKLEKIDDQQREQVRDYLANSGTIIDGSTKSDRGLGGLTDKDLKRVSAEDGANMEGLEKRLHAAAGDGKDGITPAMGRDIIDSLMKKQGFVSPDMQDLIDSTVRDGGKLTPETMKKLQGAGKAAKAAGLDLNINPGTEKDLLEHDFDKDKDESKPAPHADPGNL
jgi:predicted RNA-binding protein with RPS1 domain